MGLYPEVRSRLGERTPLRVLDLFSGIGGFSLGLERTGGFQTVAFCEIEEYPARVLAKNWPGIPVFRDVRELRAEHVGAVDVICGGFPCQDISYAGLGAGIEGERSGLWREYARLIGELRPRYVIVENVAALLRRGLDRVLGDLAALGYDAEWHGIPASAVGAPHRRDRVWIIAYAAANGRGQRRPWGFDPGAEGQSEQPLPVAAYASCVLRRTFFWQQSDGAVRSYWPENWATYFESIRSLDDGLSNEVGELSGYGNAVVPAIPEIIGRAILAAEVA
jgi:DNA (cytosine-5)-methyltransferase 1